MVNKNTSIHNLNGDLRLGYFGRIFYFILNWSNNLFPNFRSDPDLKICNFSFNNLQTKWENLPTTSSPSRKLSDLFWLSLPWKDIQKEVGGIQVFDIGCGSGNLGRRLMEWSGNMINSYTGMDIYKHPNWEKLKKENKSFNFYTIKDDFQWSIPKGTNFIISQSAIEHFDNDLLYFQKVRDYICNYGNTVIQIHLIPAKACLRLYGLHGIRQYTPRTISTITRYFKDFSYAVLFGLGGKACNKLHYEFITRPIKKENNDLRNLRPKDYDQKLLNAIKIDMEDYGKNPSFYALVVHSYWKQKLFQ